MFRDRSKFSLEFGIRQVFVSQSALGKHIPVLPKPFSCPILCARCNTQKKILESKTVKIVCIRTGIVDFSKKL
jgi:hypothetical protein